MKPTILIIISFLLFSCAESDKVVSKSDDNILLREAYFTSDSALIRTKYSDAKLVCNLWAKRGEKLDKVKDSPVSVEWDIKNEYDTSKELFIEKVVDGYSMKYEIFAHDLVVSDVDITIDSKNYKRDLSPVVTLDYKYNSSSFYTNETSSSASGGGLREIFENVDSFLVSNFSSSSSLPDVYFTNLIECSIVAKIKPQFQSQFPESID